MRLILELEERDMKPILDALVAEVPRAMPVLISRLFREKVSP